MGRPASAAATPVRLVREYFGLTLETLASYLRVSVGLVGHLDTGRRALSADTAPLLLPLLQAAATPPPEADPAAHLAPPNAAPLAARLDYCQHHAARLRRELKGQMLTLAIARRWQAALPTLLAQADDRARPWLLRRQEQAAADLDGEAAARYHLLRLRLAALETEAAGLAALLEAGS